MINYIGNKASKEELNLIFSNNLDRNIFISEYPYFESDDNKDFYVNFIDNTISKNKFKSQEDAIELSIATNTFKIEYLDIIRHIIYSRRNEWIKLICMDWLFHFFYCIPSNIFFEINEYANKSSKYELVKVQSVLNLYLQNKDVCLIQKLIQGIQWSTHSALFYRFINGLNSNSLFNDVKKTIKGDIIELINKTNTLTEAQKSGLIKSLN